MNSVAWEKYSRVCDGDLITFRPWMPEDAPELARLADDRGIWRNMADVFPHPYTLEDAHGWIALCRSQEGPPTQLAVVVDGKLVGGVGFERKSDVERFTGVFGVWLGREYWGKLKTVHGSGILFEYVFDNFDLERLEARVFEWNAASKRLMEKMGFTLESLQKKSVYKDGQLIDSWLFVWLRDDWTKKAASLQP